jgi:WD40 repeat protein
VARAGAKPQRQYHGKARGHHEWVTGVAHCGGRSVATCGADGRLCLWRSPHACEELVTADGAASLSVLLADAARPQLLLAAGYDGTARLFDVGGRRAREAGRLAPGGGAGRAPVLCAAWDREACGLGDRDGRVLVYDLGTCSRTRLLRLPAAFARCRARDSPVAFHRAGPTRRRATASRSARSATAS